MKSQIYMFRFTVVLFFCLLLSACAGVTPVPESMLGHSQRSLIVNPAPYPQIVAQTPPLGQRLGLTPMIEVVFDRPMQPDLTVAAWRFLDLDGQLLTGKSSWVDKKTFQFQPEQALLAGQKYHAVFSTQATGVDGSTLPGEIQIDYLTTDELNVGQVFPLNESVDVDYKTAITVIFNKPVIPMMTKEEAAALPSPISMQPALSGSGDWVSSSVYVFKPDPGLKSGTRYQVHVNAGLQDVTGTTLKTAYDWSFTTRAPAVIDFGLKDIGQGFSDPVLNVLLDQQFLLMFNQPMDHARVEAALSLKNLTVGQVVPLKTSWDKDSLVLTVRPDRRLDSATDYILVLSVSAQALDGGQFVAPYQIKLSTLPKPAVASVNPQDGIQTTYSAIASVFFNTQMKFDSMNALVKVIPEPKLPVKLFYREYQNQLDIFGLEPSQHYVIHLLPGMSDMYGNTIQSEYSFPVKTAGISPSAHLLTPNYPLIYRPDSEQGIFFEYTNLKSAKISLFRLGFDEFATLNNGNMALDDLGTASGKLLREFVPELLAGKDRFARILLRLDDQKPLEPGYYYLGVSANPVTTEHRFVQGAIFIVSSSTLALKATQNEALAWLVDSGSGQPLADMPLVFYNESWKEIGRANTDKFGLAHLTDVEKVQFVQSVDEKHLALAALAWGSGVTEGQSGIWTDYWSQVKSLFAFTYTERPLYRPSQPVYIKGIVRENDDLHYSLPGLDQVYLSIENEQGRVFGGVVPLSKTGTFSTEYLLGPDASVGNYTITVRQSAADEGILSWSDFRVAEYVKPEFEVNISADRPIILTGEQVKFSLDAAYYSGGSLANANINWFMEMHPYYYAAPDAYSGYSFSDYDYYDYYANGQSASNGPPVIKDGQGKTDIKGHFELPQVLEILKAGESQQVSFSANVTDVGGNLVGGSSSSIVLGSALHAGIRAENYVGMVGDNQVFNLVVLDMDGKPVSKQSVSVEFVEQRWFSVVRKDDNGVSRWETSVKTIPAGSSSVVTDENGLASVSFIPAVGGEYKAIVSALDGKGRSTKASSYIWISSSDYIAWRQTNDRSFQLVADKDNYNPGETAKILIAQPFEGEHIALITTERGHIYEKKVVQLQGNSTLYELPITADMAPVMYVSVIVIKAADGKSPPDFKMGMLRLNVSPSRQTIFVSLESDKDVAKPGDTVTYTVRTKDVDGKPVPADVSLALVDKAALALVPTNSPPLLDVFYPQKGLSVASASSIVLNAEDFNANYEETAPTGAQAGGGGKGEGGTGIVSLRETFKDTAFWQGQILTGVNGVAQVHVTVPDNLTTWQMEARAITDDTRVGEAKSELLSTLPLQIQLQTPRFFVVEDSVSLGAVVHNNTNQSLSVKVSLQSEGLSLNSDAAQTIEVQAGGQGYVIWQAQVASRATRVDLVASAESGVYRDSTRPTLGTLPGQGLPVLAFHVNETVGSAGYLREAGTVTEGIKIPQNLGQSMLNATLNLDVSPSLAASMTDGLTYLNDYPYLCMEQTVSRFLPNLISIEALKLAGRDTDSLKTSLDTQVQPALQRIINNQNGDGGWGLWPGSPSQPTTTAYVMLGLEESLQAGYTVPEYTLSQGFGYLEGNLPGDYAGNDTWKNNQTAFILYALARGERSNGGQLSELYASRQKLDLYGQALLMQTLFMVDKHDVRIQNLLSSIVSAAAKSAAGTWWNEKNVDYWNWNTDVRTTAIVLNALIQVDPQNAFIPDGIRWLMKHREGSHWYSTQETAWSLMALTNWLSLSGELQANYAYDISLNSEQLASKHADPVHLSETTSLNLDVEKFLSDVTNTLTITRGDGPGVLYYTAYMDYSLPVKDIQAIDQGILVSQQYFSPNDLKTPVNEVIRGDLVQVRLTLVVPHSLHYVVIDDPLPAGLEALDSSLQTSQQVPSAYQPQDYERYGWGWWYFYYKQIYDEKVVMSADYLPAGTYTINFLARASTAGAFHVLPTTAKEFYFPDVFGRSAGSDFIVKP